MTIETKQFFRGLASGLLIGLLLGAACGMEWAAHDARQDLAAIESSQDAERADWQKEKRAMAGVIATQMGVIENYRAQLERTQPNSALPQGTAAPPDPGNLLPEIVQPGAQSYAEQQAAAQKQREQAEAAARAIARALLR